MKHVLIKGGSDWSSGAAPFFVDELVGRDRACVAVMCRIEHIGEHRAMLDTASTWTVIGGDLGQALTAALPEKIESICMTTRLGRVRGDLCSVPLTLVAQEGDDLVIEATVLVAPDWPGPPVVLGYTGLLEKIRFALDPGVTQGDQWLYFGESE